MSKFTAFVIVLLLAICLMFGALIYTKNDLLEQQKVQQQEELAKKEEDFNKTEAEAIPESIDDEATVNRAEEVTEEAQTTAKETLENASDEQKGYVSEYNDTVTIDYVGISGGEEFEGGTAQDYSITIGSNSFITGFESQLEGHKVGDVFNVNVTFPEDYKEATLAGKDAIFVVTMKGMTKAEEV